METINGILAVMVLAAIVYAWVLMGLVKRVEYLLSLKRQLNSMEHFVQQDIALNQQILSRMNKDE